MTVNDFPGLSFHDLGSGYLTKTIRDDHFAHCRIKSASSVVFLTNDTISQGTNLSFGTGLYLLLLSVSCFKSVPRYSEWYN